MDRIFFSPREEALFIFTEVLNSSFEISSFMMTSWLLWKNEEVHGRSWIYRKKKEEMSLMMDGGDIGIVVTMDFV